MRTTYEDLLRVAWRAAIDVRLEEHSDPLRLAGGWQAVLTATRHHLGWLKGRLNTPDPAIDASVEEGSSLSLLARAIGVGADLLALHDARNTTKPGRSDAFPAARAEVAAIVLIGATAALRDAGRMEQRDESVGILRAHLKTAIWELEQYHKPARRRRLGVLRGLAVGGPRTPVDTVELVAQAAARWQREHESVEPGNLLTRDLRSMTAQLRTVCGWACHLAKQLHSADRRLQLGLSTENELSSVVTQLADFDGDAARVARCWQSRLSDISGQSATPGEVAFRELATVLKQFGRRGGRLLCADELISDRQGALGLLDALDELVYSAARVARIQPRAIASQVPASKLYVPLAVLVRKQPDNWPIGIGSRNKPKLWVTTNRPDCFTDLHDAVGAAYDRLLEASAVVRRLAGTAAHLRPDFEFPSTLPSHAFGSLRGRDEVAIGIETLDAVREFGGLNR